MTETEWLASDKPEAMLRFLWRIPEHRQHHPQLRDVSERKLWLLFFALDRHDLTFAEPTGDEAQLEERRLILAKCEVGERFADGQATAEDVLRARYPSRRAFKVSRTDVWGDLRRTLRMGGDSWKPGAAEGVCGLFREIVGNPFRPWCREDVYLSDPDAQSAMLASRRAGEKNAVNRVVRRAWLTRDVLALAEAIYAECRWQDMPVLADALTDAGCETLVPCDVCQGTGSINFGLADGTCDGCYDSYYVDDGGYWRGKGLMESQLLRHLRGLGPHVKGCWVLDLLLDKE